MREDPAPGGLVPQENKKTAGGRMPYGQKDMMGTQEASLEYFQQHRCALQWRDFLGALAEEFDEQLQTPELRALASRIGERFARRLPLPHCETLEDLHHGINEVWSRLDWGWVEIGDAGDYIEIAHHCAPLTAALGEASRAWSPAFLEGVYQQWFNELGIDPALRVRQETSEEQGASLWFRLAR